MKPSRIGALAALLATILIAALARGDGSTTAPAVGGSYVDHTNHFAIDGPVFDAPSGLGSAMALMVQAPVDKGFAANVNVMLQPKVDRDAYTSVTIQQIVAIGGTIRQQRQLRVSNHDGLRFDYDAPVQGHALHFMALAVFGDDHVYLVTCTSLPNPTAAQVAEFEKCLNSFRIAP